jgi:hypothetical protein
MNWKRFEKKKVASWLNLGINPALAWRHCAKPNSIRIAAAPAAALPAQYSSSGPTQ